MAQLFILDSNEDKWRANGDICFKMLKMYSYEK